MLQSAFNSFACKRLSAFSRAFGVLSFSPPPPLLLSRVPRGLFHSQQQSSEVETTKPVLLVGGPDDELFYQKYTTLGQHAQFKTAGAFDRKAVSHIMRQTKLKHAFLSDSNMYAASPNLAAAQAQISKNVGVPVVYTLLPRIESYLILSEMLTRSEEAYALRHHAIRVIYKHMDYFFTSFKSMREESGLGLSTKSSETAPNDQQNKVFTAVDRLFPRMDPNGPEMLWSELVHQQRVNASSSSFDPVGFWTTYVKMVDGKKAMVRGPDGEPRSTDAMICKTTCLHPKVQALLDQTVQAALQGLK
ncbi:hypothetical protein CAOG_07865 [Capsaspora owczarzaki ATCC 30864]|uniref:Uncharacterized protein n=1 Tax=Capsaspora owczarzaki (strain ATCC 30864) TaxID=595528 RepID=A0A0D2W0L7_CAPO3|nr:hypothetical protein CAOG_07865 [Capsaspora owczarzaki ATCC 30864]KJE97762.1 hypothetical protein CAOG_007865 [Capsaspora owczarzaki ATCC 30864]|eukprot:XP_004342950.1 hypothetical protein CAOG_07865 [Capsaspora owczarzaki ATCC 30864]